MPREQQRPLNTANSVRLSYAWGRRLGTFDDRLLAIPMVVPKDDLSTDRVMGATRGLHGHEDKLVGPHENTNFHADHRCCANANKASSLALVSKSRGGRSGFCSKSRLPQIYPVIHIWLPIKFPRLIRDPIRFRHSDCPIWVRH